jgi:inositol phosphorylceramide mannosyltransferase catalytic subunit
MVPKVFHRVWLGRQPLPELFERWGATWLEHHPGWEMKLWTEDNLPPTAFPEMMAAADSLAHASDIARYEVLAREGGVYIDTDFECFRSIEPLITDLDAFTARHADEEWKAMGNCFFGVTPGHPMMLDLLDKMPHVRDRNKTYKIGPPFFTRMVRKHNVHVFPQELFYPYPSTQCWRRNEKFPGAYAAHHWASLWTNSWGRFGDVVRPT